jgi:catechol 2,3-dioxygenase-like lactoylglutathione lyase family enzyme
VLSKATLTAFLATTDTPRSKTFYESVLGLRLKTDDEFALAFDCNGIELRVQKVKEFRSQPFTALGWRVTGLRSTMVALAKRGATFERYPFLEQDDLGVWQAPSGARVAWFKDPDGNLLSLTELGAAITMSIPGVR